MKHCAVLMCVILLHLCVMQFQICKRFMMWVCLVFGICMTPCFLLCIVSISVRWWHTLTYTDAHVATCLHHTHIHMCACTHTCMCTSTHAHAHTHTHAHTSSPPHTHTRVCVCACAHAHTLGLCTQTQTQTHSFMHSSHTQADTFNFISYDFYNIFKSDPGLGSIFITSFYKERSVFP